MKRDELNGALERLAPSDAQKKVMLEKLRPGAAPVKRRVNPFYIAAPVAAAMVMCSALVLFGLRGGRSVQITPSDPIAELPGVSSRQSDTVHENVYSASNDENSKIDTASGADSQAIHSSMPSSQSVPPDLLPSRAPVVSQSGTSKPPEQPDLSYDFSDITVDYSLNELSWDADYFDWPESSKPTTSSGDDLAGVGGDSVGAVESEDDAWGGLLGTEFVNDDSVLRLGNRVYTAKGNEFLRATLQNFSPDDIGPLLSTGPNGEGIYRYGGESDDIMAVKNPKGGWTPFFFDGFATDATGREMLALYGATSPEMIQRIYLGYVANDRACEQNITDLETIETFYDGVYCAKAEAGGYVNYDRIVQDGTQTYTVVVYLRNGHAIYMEYVPDAEWLFHGNSLYDTTRSGLDETIRDMIAARR